MTPIFALLLASLSLASALPAQRHIHARNTGGLHSGASWANLAWANIDSQSDAQGKDVVFVDLEKSNGNPGKYRSSTVVCYMSAGTVENWRPDAHRFKPYTSEKSKYSGETWLDITRWRDFSPLMAQRIDRMVSEGCDAIEADNVDCFLHDCVDNASQSELKKHQTEYVRWLAQTAHNKGLKIGLKNAIEILKTLEGSVDFAINESCTRFDECSYYNVFKRSGKAVFGVEYSAGRSACSEGGKYGISMKYNSGNGFSDC